jgi:hypothetical protein
MILATPNSTSYVTQAAFEAEQKASAALRAQQGDLQEMRSQWAKAKEAEAREEKVALDLN